MTTTKDKTERLFWTVIIVGCVLTATLWVVMMFAGIMLILDAKAGKDTMERIKKEEKRLKDKEFEDWYLRTSGGIPVPK